MLQKDNISVPSAASAGRGRRPAKPSAATKCSVSRLEGAGALVRAAPRQALVLKMPYG